MRNERINELNGLAERPGDFGLYWMQASVRAEGNLALEWAVTHANELGLPLLVVFCLVENYTNATPTHYRHLLSGLAEAQRDLAEKGIRLAIFRGSPEVVLGRVAARAAFLATDAGYLRLQRSWLAAVSAAVPCRAVRIEGDVLVPPAVASQKEEWSAFTLRRRLMPLLDGFLDACDERTPRKSSLDIDLSGDLSADLSQIKTAPPGIPAGRSVDQRISEKSGTAAALGAFEDFLSNRLDRYVEDRNDPNAEGGSRMSAAIHFGHVSPVELVRRTLHAVGERSARECRHPGAAAYIEELVVRRELAVNMAYYRDDYDNPSCLPDWARKTLADGALHPRERRYTFEELECARTEDPYWNAAQDQMVRSGLMHGYMRMYWGKRLLAWTASPEEAWNTAVLLNDRYSLDGRDPNGYAGIAWCFGKHDRPWTGRPIYGTVRYMNANGLRRKFDADAYVRRVQELKEAQCSTI